MTGLLCSSERNRSNPVPLLSYPSLQGSASHRLKSIVIRRYGLILSFISLKLHPVWLAVIKQALYRLQARVTEQMLQLIGFLNG